MLQYWDSYVRVEGEWCFQRRRFHRWYIVDALARDRHTVPVSPTVAGRASATTPTARRRSRAGIGSGQSLDQSDG